MSESRAKRERKEQPKQAAVAPKKSKAEIIISIVAVLLVVAVAGLGVYALKDEIKALLPEPQIKTIGDYAESIETTAEELLAKCGMEDLGLTEKSDMDEMYEKFTIDSYAKFTDTDAETLKAVYGIQDLANDTSWQEAQMKMPMFKVAEQAGLSFDDFAAQNQLPAEITKDTTYEDALKIMEAKFSEENPEE